MRNYQGYYHKQAYRCSFLDSTVWDGGSQQHSNTRGSGSLGKVQGRWDAAYCCDTAVCLLKVNAAKFNAACMVIVIAGLGNSVHDWTLT